MAISAIIIVVSIVFDQITKILAKNSLCNADDVVAIPHILGFTYVENRGAAFGIFANSRWVFMIFSTIAIGVMIYLLYKLKKQHMLLLVSLSMLIGGGIGNMIDRIFRGYVVDFFEFLFMDFAVFNVADCFVTIGAVLLAFYLLFMYDDKEEKSKIISDNVENIDSKNVDSDSENEK